MGLKKYHAVLISSKDFWIFDPDSYDSTTKLYGDFTVIKGSSKKEDSDMKQCSYFFEIGNQDNHGFKPIAIKYDEAEGFLIVEGEQQPMGKNKKRVFQIGEEARRYKNMRGPRHSVDTIVVSRDSKKQEIKDYLKQQQDDSKSAETFQADTLNQINPIFVEGAEDVMGAESNDRMSELENKAKKLYLDEIDEVYIKEVCDEYDLDYHDKKDYAKACSKYLDQIDYIHILDMLDSDDLKELKQLYKDNDISYYKQMGAESEIFCADCGGRRKYDAESFDAEHSCGCGDEMALEAELIGAKAKGKKFLRVGDLKKALKKTKDTDKVIAGDLYDEKVYLTTKVFKDGNQVAIVGQDGYHYYDDHMDNWDAESFEANEYSYYHRKKAERAWRKNYEESGILQDREKWNELYDSFDKYKSQGFSKGQSMVKSMKEMGIYNQLMQGVNVDAFLDHYSAESFESEWVIEAVQQNLNDKDFVNYAYKVLIGGDAKTFEEKSMAIAETMNQNANNEDFTSFVENSLFKDAEDVVELVQEVSPFPMGKLFASFIVVGVSAIAGAKLLNR